MLLLNLLLCCLLSSQEIERRIAIDFNKQINDILPFIQRYYPDVDSAQIAEWEKCNALEYQMINGEKWYFRNAAPNLFRIDKDAKLLKTSIDGKEKAGRDSVIEKHVKQILSATHDNKHNQPFFIPHKWSFNYSIIIPDNPELNDGDSLKVWLPAPNINIKRQLDVKLFYSNKEVTLYTDNVHASAYMEDRFDTNDENKFEVTYCFSTHAEYHKIPKCFKHKKTDLSNKDLQPYLAERAPHCIFSNKLKHLTDSLIGKEKRPYYQARKLFKAIRELFPWASAREYSTIDNIPEYVIENGHGDCGQVTLLYIAMCRYIGIPARWQSGFMLHPGYENLHDWCEIYIEGLGWIPVDPSFGIQEWGKTLEEKYFYFGGIDAYRLIVNTDWGNDLSPQKEFERSETVDFQRGECECSKKNLYFNQWKYRFNVKIIK